MASNGEKTAEENGDTVRKGNNCGSTLRNSGVFSPQDEETSVPTECTSDTAEESEQDILIKIGCAYDTDDLGRLDYIKHITYNLSSFHRRHTKMPKEWRERIDNFVSKLDETVKVDLSNPEHQVIVDGIEKIVNQVCDGLRKMKNKFKCYDNIAPKPTGSLYANLRVGRPYEADFLLKMGSEEGFFHHPDYKDTGFMSHVRKVTLKIKEVNWCVHGVYAHRVGVCVVLEYAGNDSNQRLGVLVDLVPVLYTDEYIDACDLTHNARKMIENNGKFHKYYVIYEAYELTRQNVFNKDVDTGLLEHSILCKISDHIKQGYRVAKYLLQNKLIWSGFSLYDSRDKAQFLTLKDYFTIYGYPTLINSHIVQVLLLKLLLEGTKVKFGPGGIVLCLLDMVFDLVKKIGDLRFSVYNYMLEKVSEDMTVYTEVHSFTYVNIFLLNVIAEFLKNSRLSSFSCYKLINCNGTNHCTNNLSVLCQSSGLGIYFRNLDFSNLMNDVCIPWCEPEELIALHNNYQRIHKIVVAESFLSYFTTPTLEFIDLMEEVENRYRASTEHIIRGLDSYKKEYPDSDVVRKGVIDVACEIFLSLSIIDLTKECMSISLEAIIQRKLKTPENRAQPHIHELLDLIISEPARNVPSKILSVYMFPASSMDKFAYALRTLWSDYLQTRRNAGKHKNRTASASHKLNKPVLRPVHATSITKKHMRCRLQEKPKKGKRIISIKKNIKYYHVQAERRKSKQAVDKRMASASHKQRKSVLRPVNIIRITRKSPHMRSGVQPKLKKRKTLDFD